MRITVAHTKTKAEVMQAVDRSFDDIFRNVGSLPIRTSDEQRKWEGSTLRFSFTARMGLLSSPIKGTVVVTEKDVTIDADLGLLERLLGAAGSSKAIASKIAGNVRGFLT
jgi:Putative polyhydroxyalkanoic acid system protein (PHA_gran_rgn)